MVENVAYMGYGDHFLRLYCELSETTVKCRLRCEEGGSEEGV